MNTWTCQSEFRRHRQIVFYGGLKDKAGRCVGCTLMIQENGEMWSKGIFQRGVVGWMQATRDGQPFGPLDDRSKHLYASVDEAKADLEKRALTAKVRVLKRSEQHGGVYLTARQASLHNRAARENSNG